MLIFCAWTWPPTWVTPTKSRNLHYYFAIPVFKGKNKATVSGLQWTSSVSCREIWQESKGFTSTEQDLIPTSLDSLVLFFKVLFPHFYFLTPFPTWPLEMSLVAPVSQVQACTAPDQDHSFAWRRNTTVCPAKRKKVYLQNSTSGMSAARTELCFCAFLLPTDPSMRNAVPCFQSWNCCPCIHIFLCSLGLAKLFLSVRATPVRNNSSVQLSHWDGFHCQRAALDRILGRRFWLGCGEAPAHLKSDRNGPVFNLAD